MLRSELIRILQETTRDYQRDGKVLIELLTGDDPEETCETLGECLIVLGTTESLGNGEAITIITCHKNALYQNNPEGWELVR